MSLEDYLNWFEVTDELVIETYDTDVWGEVSAIHFVHGETLERSYE